MKRILLLTAIALITIGTLDAQSFDYKKRNHKLNKNYEADLAKDGNDFVLITASTANKINSVLERNAKFHKHNSSILLVKMQSDIQYDYKARNRKFKKHYHIEKQNRKEFKSIPRNTIAKG